MRYQTGWAGWKDEEQPFTEFASRSDSPVIDCSMIDWDRICKIKSQTSDIAGKRFAFWDAVIKLTGKHLPNTNQLLGDCVAAGTEMSSEYKLANQIVTQGKLELYRPIYRPWLYGIGRVFIGKGRIRGDGSVATWQYQGMEQYGILAEDEPGLPRYSTAVGRQWGNDASVLKKWAPLAAKTKITKYIRIKSFQDLANTVINLQASPTIASSRGFEMKLRHDPSAGCSWFVPSGTWQHLMHIAAVDCRGAAGRAYVGNQWSYSAHPGQLDGPDGGGWVKEDMFHQWVRSDSVYCLAALDIDAWDIELLDALTFKMN